MNDYMSKILKPIEDMLDRVGVDHVFGQPITEGDTVVIPVADVTLGFGYGFGEGTGPKTPGTEEAGEGAPGEPGASQAVGSGSGGGGGAGGRAKARGFIRIKPDGVVYEPIMDQSRIALAGICLSGWIVFWITKTVRAFAPPKG
jgi:uncharacterized spore protein YtfJ